MKKKERTIPYRVYKRLFPDCEAYGYSGGKITVVFPEDYLNSRMYTPEGWSLSCNHIDCNFGRTAYGAQVWGTICQHSDGGCKYYDAYVSIGNTFAGGRQMSKQYIRSFEAALSWVNSKVNDIM